MQHFFKKPPYLYFLVLWVSEIMGSTGEKREMRLLSDDHDRKQANIQPAVSYPICINVAVDYNNLRLQPSARMLTFTGCLALTTGCQML